MKDYRLVDDERFLIFRFRCQCGRDVQRRETNSSASRHASVRRFPARASKLTLCGLGDPNRVCFRCPAGTMRADTAAVAGALNGSLAGSAISHAQGAPHVRARTLFRQQLATEHRRRDPNPDRIADLQRERAAVRVEDFAAESSPPRRLSVPEQRQHLAEVMLRGGGAHGTDAA